MVNIVELISFSRTFNIRYDEKDYIVIETVAENGDSKTPEVEIMVIHNYHVVQDDLIIKAVTALLLQYAADVEARAH